MALAEQTGVPDVPDEGWCAVDVGILLRECTHGRTRQLSTVDRARWLAIRPADIGVGDADLAAERG